MYMLDTNILVRAIRQKDHPVRLRLANCIAGELCISAISYAELVYGVCHSAAPERNRAALLESLSKIDILPFDAKAGQCAGEIMAHLAAKGQPIGDRDMLIAGHALALGLPLITHNVREFERIPGLRIEDWLMD